MRRIWTRTSRSTASIPAGRLYSKAEAFMSKIAEFYAGEIVSLFPDGPYVIGGNCHGAKVAVKIARILMESGRRVEKLCFLEYPGTNLHELGKPVHIHVDQKNDPAEDCTETVIRLIDELGLAYPAPEPLVWLVHVISPSTYDEARFTRLAEALAERNIGVICCPSAALSMRQLRPLATPTGNSIARVLEMLAAGVRGRLGSDNLCDVTSPAGTVDLVDELFVLTNAVRFYDIDIMSKLGAGEPLDAADRAKIRTHLEHDLSEVAIAIGQRA